MPETLQLRYFVINVSGEPIASIIWSEVCLWEPFMEMEVLRFIQDPSHAFPYPSRTNIWCLFTLKMNEWTGLLWLAGVLIYPLNDCIEVLPAIIMMRAMQKYSLCPDSRGIQLALQHDLDPCCVMDSGVLTEFKQEIAQITSFTISNNQFIKHLDYFKYYFNGVWGKF